MSSSTPADLAVAFRSMARRLRNAQTDRTPSTAVRSASQEIDSAISAAAGVVGSGATADGVAAALEARRPVEWTNEQLADIQRHADAAARAIRQIENLSERE